jgi:hypothetical protein
MREGVLDPSAQPFQVRLRGFVLSVLRAWLPHEGHEVFKRVDFGRVWQGHALDRKRICRKEAGVYSPDSYQLVTSAAAAEEAEKAKDACLEVLRHFPALGDRLVVVLQRCGLAFGEVRLDAIRPDPRDAFRRQEALAAQKAGRDDETGEDVCVGVARDLVHIAQLLTGRSVDAGALLEGLPGNFGLAQTDRPAIRQTGPWVA